MLLLLLPRLCSNAPCRTGAAVIIGSMAVKEREGLEYHAPASFVPGRTSLRRLSIASNNDGRDCIRMKERRGAEEEGRQCIHIVHSVPPFSLPCSQRCSVAALERWDLQQKAGDKRGCGLSSSGSRGWTYFLWVESP